MSCKFITQITAIIELELRKIRHDPFELCSRIVQPALWLLIFGQAMAKVHAIDTGSTAYLDFLAPGILAQATLFTSIFYGIALIWERDMGILHKIIVSPSPRYALVLGRGLAAGARSLTQALAIYILCFILGVDVNYHIKSILAVCGFVCLGGFLFSTFSLIIASIVKKRERFMGIGQILTMPMFFASNALYPVALMPQWLQNISHFNPLTYQVDAFRSLMILGEKSVYGLGFDFLILFSFCFLFTVIATISYPKILL